MTIKINCNYIITFAIYSFIRLFLVNRLDIQNSNIVFLACNKYYSFKFNNLVALICRNIMATLSSVLYNTYILLFTTLLNALWYYVDLLI